MTANELFTFVAQVSGFLGIVGSMLAMGLGLTLAQIMQPLKNARLVILALLANFVLVASIVIPLILLPTARWLGTRSEAAALTAPPLDTPLSGSS